MTRIARPAARRIDRLARGAHAFHRFAHHPLCGAYASEVVRVGRRTRVCRGCLASLVGAAFGATVAMAWAPLTAVVLASLGCVGLAGAWMRTRQRSMNAATARTSKAFTRALPLALGAFSIVGGLRLGRPLGLACALAASLAIALAFWIYRRFGPRRSPCLACPERGQVPCSGTREIWRRERAFSRAAQKLIRAR